MFTQNIIRVGARRTTTTISIIIRHVILLGLLLLLSSCLLIVSSFSILPSRSITLGIVRPTLRSYFTKNAMVTMAVSSPSNNDENNRLIISRIKTRNRALMMAGTDSNVLNGTATAAATVTTGGGNAGGVLRSSYDNNGVGMKKIETDLGKKAWDMIDGPSLETKPNYEEIHGPLGKFMDDIFLTVFRTKMSQKVGFDSNLPKNDYQGLMELTAALNSRYSNRREVQRIAQDILRSLFPSWLPGSFAVMFSKPFPEFSCRLNAWATKMAGTWLMGECELNDCEVDGGGIGTNQGLLVKRCRFLEESGCASVCVNSCKIPTQNFFAQDMGLPLTMTPDYETGECQFSFGLTPNVEGELDAKNTPCLSRCPSSGRMRVWHNGGQDMPKSNDGLNSRCTLMDNDESINNQ